MKIKMLVHLASSGGCFFCQKTGKCWIKDDMEIVCTKFLESSGTIIGTPVCFCSMPGKAKVLLDGPFLYDILSSTR